MGQSITKEDVSSFDEKAKAAVGSDGKVRAICTFGRGVGFIIHSDVKVVKKSVYRDGVEAVVRGIKEDTGDPKRMLYVSGTPYEMGYLTGMLHTEATIALCKDYLRHVAPQFISEALDHALTHSLDPIISKSYDQLLGLFVDMIKTPIYEEFMKNVEAGLIPKRYLQEMKGVVDGVNSTKVVNAITIEDVVAASYSVDYITRQVFNGQLIKQAQSIWGRYDLNETMFKTPDMCNAFTVTGDATLNGETYMMRDFQFVNAATYDKHCTIIIRQPTDPTINLSASVCMPGMMGCVTGLNEHGVSVGVNMVRSAAIDEEWIGPGCLLMTRIVTDTSKSSDSAVQVVRDTHIGVPWIYYVADPSGQCHVIETIADVHDSPDKLRPNNWIKDENVLRIVNSVDMKKFRGSGGHGVWVRNNKSQIPSDRESYRNSIKLLTEKSDIETKESDWIGPGQFIYSKWQDENNQVGKVANYYFPPVRHMKDVLVINNSFHWPNIRVTQMTELAALVERVATANQWRRDTITSQLHAKYGKLTFEDCWDIIQFLSPHKRPEYPQNAYSRRKLHSLETAINSLLHGVDIVDDGLKTVGDYELSVSVSGSMTGVDNSKGMIMNKSGYWGSKPYRVHLFRFKSLKEYILLRI